MSKAKSRLKPANNPKLRLEFSPQKYFRHWPLLFLGLIFLGITYWLLTTISPVQIQNTILPNTYLPLLTPVFLMSFFLLSFFFLNSRRGLILALILTLILFFKLQPITNWFTPALIASALLLSIEVGLTFFSHH